MCKCMKCCSCSVSANDTHHNKKQQIQNKTRYRQRNHNQNSSTDCFDSPKFYRRTTFIKSDRRIHSAEFIAYKRKEYKIDETNHQCKTQAKEYFFIYQRIYKRIYTPCKSWQKIYNICYFQDGIFSEFIEEKQTSCFQRQHPFQLCGIYRKINAAWIQIKLLQFSKCRRHFILKENMSRKIAALFLCKFIFFASMHCHNHIIAYIKFYFKQNVIESHILCL